VAYDGSFVHLPVFPTDAELSNPPGYLNPHRITEPYNSVPQYIETIYRLLREDCFGPLRDGIHELARERELAQRLGAGAAAAAGRRTSAQLRVYRNVEVMSCLPGDRGIVHVLRLDLNDPRMKRTNWKACRALMYGSLLAATADDAGSVALSSPSFRGAAAMSLIDSDADGCCRFQLDEDEDEGEGEGEGGHSRVLWATVEDRSDSIDKSGFFAVEFRVEDVVDPRLTPGCRLTLVESPVYFQAHAQ
jgi:hypothetical protein